MRAIVIVVVVLLSLPIVVWVLLSLPIGLKGYLAIQRRRRERNDAVLFEDCRRPWLNHVNRRLPAAPRCRLCFAPFGGLGRVLRIRPSRKNPNLCDACFERAPIGGHEMDIGVLFADVRGFTASSEHRSPDETAQRLNRFYNVATEVLIAHDALIDKLVGDQVMALFLPQFPALGERTCDAMVTAAEELLRATGSVAGSEPWVQLGLGLNYGPAFVGNVGSGEIKDFTAIGDVVNTAERLQACASAGQIVVSEEVYGQLSSRYPDAPRETLSVKGKAAAVQARRLQPVRATGVKQ